ncbi:MAG: glycosyltransferase family 39 protein [Thermoprotei archaeon]|nr:glycosyltransferase family 39 protein [Thermoprotei archaeon]
MNSRLLMLAYYLVTLAVALGSSVYIFTSAYSLASSYGDRYVSDEIYYVDSARRLLQRVFHVDINYHNYSGKTSEDYYNLEHPPLGKYLIGLSMIVCGDKPTCWRLPGIIEASLMPLILYIAYATLRNPLAPAAGAVAALALALDPIVYRATSVAMLDAHLAFITSLSIALSVRGRFAAAGVLAALSSTVKISGAGTILGYLMSLYRVDRVKKRLALAIASIAAAALLYALVHAPLASHFGVERIVDENIRAVKWHTTTRPPGGPPASNPSGWILNVAPFAYTFDPAPVYAELNTIIHLVALAFSVYILVTGILWGMREYSLAATLYYAGITLAYWAVYIAGNKTLYSFYAIQLSPAAAGTLAELLLVAWNGKGLDNNTKQQTPQTFTP